MLIGSLVWSHQLDLVHFVRTFVCLINELQHCPSDSIMTKNTICFPLDSSSHCYWHICIHEFGNTFMKFCMRFRSIYIVRLDILVFLLVGGGLPSFILTKCLSVYFISVITHLHPYVMFVHTVLSCVYFLSREY